MAQEHTDLPEGPRGRALRIARVGASYGFDFVLGRQRLIPGYRKRVDPERVGERMRLSFEELGPTFVELGHFLAARADRLPPRLTTRLQEGHRVAKPAPPSEIRRIVERELGNSVERLFMDFEEVPVRVGAFTQSHRAMLPGDRPALVVVNRPAIQRELLAMRPIAEIVRRRAGDLIPVNPVEMAGEFAAHVGGRRDMFAAAQNARRISEHSSLRIPESYRDYSAGACVTFELPRQWALLGPRRRPELADALIKLAVGHGIFLADPAIERFAESEGGIWVVDPTESIIVDPERMRGLAEVLAAVRRQDIDAVLRALPMAGAVLPRRATALQRELRETLGSLGGPLWRERTLEEIRDQTLEALRRGDSHVPLELELLMDFLARAERLGGEGYNGVIPAVEVAGGLISRYRDPAYIAARTARRVVRPQDYADYPRKVHAILEELKDGEVEVRFNHRGLDDLISKVDILANRLVFALLISALILGSSLLGVFGQAGVRVLGLNIFGFLGFVLAAVLGLALLVGIIRSGRL